MTTGDFLPPVNFGRIPSEDSQYENARVIIVPVPYDATSEWHTGSQKGPQAIITASEFLEFYDLELNSEIYRLGIHTLPDIRPELGNPAKMFDRVFEIASTVLGSNKLPVMIGGEHSLTTGMVRAIKKKYDDITVLQLDAHSDLRDRYMGSEFNHACVMRRIFEMCPFVPVGIRSMSREELQFLKEHKIEVFYADEAPVTDTIINRINSRLSSNVYITIDLDVFDPAVMSAVATPEPGGLKWYDLLKLLKAVAGKKNIVGFDVVELCPSQGPDSCAYMAAKLIYKLIGYIFTGKTGKNPSNA